MVINIGHLVSFLADIGASNMVAVLTIVNTPSLLLVMLMYNKMKAEAADHYIQKETYDKDIKVLYTKTLQPLRDDIKKLRSSIDGLANSLDNQREVMARHDERLKILNGKT